MSEGAFDDEIAEETAAEPEEEELLKMQELQETAIRTTQNMISHLSKTHSASGSAPKPSTTVQSKKQRKDPVSFGQMLFSDSADYQPEKLTKDPQVLRSDFLAGTTSNQEQQCTYEDVFSGSGKKLSPPKINHSTFVSGDIVKNTVIRMNQNKRQ